MHLQFQIDGLDAVQRKIDDMAHKIGEIKRNDLGDELAEWQEQDMNRSKAYVKRVRRGVMTTVRPHSRFEMLASRRYQRRMLRRIKTGTRAAARAWMEFQARTSMRPILRAQLKERLVERMTNLLREKLRW